MPQAQLQTLETIARSALMDLGEDESRLEQFLHWAIEGYKDYHFDQARSTKIKKIPINEHKGAPLPEDYVDWVRVGVQVEGRWIKLTHDPKIFQYPKTFPKQSGSYGQGYHYYNPFNDKGEHLGKDWGLGEKHNGYGYFSVGEYEIQLNASKVSGKEIILQYLSNELCGDSAVHPYAAKMIKLYVLWQRKENNDRFGIAEKRRAEELYYREQKKVALRLMNLSVDEIIETFANASGF